MRPSFFDMTGSSIKNRNKLTAVLFFVVGVGLLTLTLGASRQNQDIRERAQTSTDTAAPNKPINLRSAFNASDNTLRFSWDWGGDNPIGGVEYCRRCSVAGLPTPDACVGKDANDFNNGYKTGATGEVCNPNQVGPFWWHIANTSDMVNNQARILYHYYNASETGYYDYNSNETTPLVDLQGNPYAPGGTSYLVDCDNIPTSTSVGVAWLRLDVATRDANGNIATINGVPSEVSALKVKCAEPAAMTFQLKNTSGQYIGTSDFQIRTPDGNNYNMTSGLYQKADWTTGEYRLIVPSGSTWTVASEYCTYNQTGTAAAECNFTSQAAIVVNGTAQQPVMLGWVVRSTTEPTVIPTPTSALGPSCQALQNIITAAYFTNCGDTNYNKVADLNKDGQVRIADQTLFRNIASDEAACSDFLTDQTDPCASPVPTLGPSCQALSDIITTAYFTNCGDAGYNKVADLDKDGHVRITDFSILRANSTNETACTTFRNDQTDPCVSTPTVTPPVLPAPQTRRTNCDSDSSTHMVCGYVFVDANNDGIRQTTEAGVAQVPVTVTGAATVTANSVASGWFNTTGLTLGTYTVTMQTPAGYTGTTRNTSSINLTVADPDNDPTNDDSDGLVNFGIVAAVNTCTPNTSRCSGTRIEQCVYNDISNPSLGTRWAPYIDCATGVNPVCVVNGTVASCVASTTPTVSPTTPPVGSCNCQTGQLQSVCSSGCTAFTTSGFQCRSNVQCTRVDRSHGDADGVGGVSLVDLDWYRRWVLGDTTIATQFPAVNTDFNGDGQTSPEFDLPILLRTLGLIPQPTLAAP